MNLRSAAQPLALAFIIIVTTTSLACSEGPSTATAPSCSFRVTVQSNSFGPAGGTGTAAVSTSPGCGWSAASSADWISVSSGATGRGDGQVGFAVAAYEGSSDRAGSLVIAKETIAIAQSACTIQFSPTEQSFPDGSSTRDITLQAQPGCRWSLEGTPSWLTLTPATGVGDATVKIQVSENDAPGLREATVRAGNATLSIKQGGEPERCNFALDVQPAQFNETGGHGTVGVNTREGCTWQLAADSDWIKLSSSSGTGSSRVAFDVPPNAQPSDRRAILRIDGTTAPIMQFANQCSFGVTPVQQCAHSYGDSGSVNVRAGAGCEWTASPAAPWIHIDRAGGTGSGEIRFTVDRKLGIGGDGGRVRKAPIEIRWKTPTIGENAWLWQFSDCHAALLGGGHDSTPGITSPAPFVVAFPPEGGNAHVDVLVESPFSCNWIIETLPAPPFELGHADAMFGILFEGDSNIHVLVPPNTTGTQRTTTMIIAERTLTLTQSSK